MKISYVIPCYNSEKTIKNVVKEIQDVMQKNGEYQYEIILVNDCSKDKTAEVIKELEEQYDNMKAISFAKNFGQPSALLAGFNYVSGDYIMTLDDDGQTPIEHVFEFINKMEQGNYDVVCGKYTERENQSLFRRCGSWLNKKMSDLLIQKPAGVYMSSFFLARPFVIKEMIRYRHAYPYIAGLILRVTQNIGNVEVIQRKRSVGSSGYTLKKLLNLWLNGFTAFSIKPLRVAVLFGCSFSAVGFIMGIVIIIRKLLNVSIQAGWSSIIAVLLVIGGLLMLFLGIIGEYIGRIYMCINESPQYVIREMGKSVSDSEEDKELR